MSLFEGQATCPICEKPGVTCTDHPWTQRPIMWKSQADAYDAEVERVASKARKPVRPELIEAAPPADVPPDPV